MLLEKECDVWIILKDCYESKVNQCEASLTKLINTNIIQSEINTFEDAEYKILKDAENFGPYTIKAVVDTTLSARALCDDICFLLWGVLGDYHKIIIHVEPRNKAVYVSPDEKEYNRINKKQTKIRKSLTTKLPSV